MGGGKRTRERALAKIIGPLQKSFWSALSWIFVQEKQTPERGGKHTVRGGVQNPFLGVLSLMRFSSPPFFHPPQWRPLSNCNEESFERPLNLATVNHLHIWPS